MLPSPNTDSPDDGVPAAHPHTEFGAARVALALSDFSPDDLDAFACVANTLRDTDEDDHHADVARLAVNLAALPPLTRWAATVINWYWAQPETRRLAYIVHFSWSRYPGEAVDEIARVTAAFDWKKPPPAPLPDGAHGAYLAIGSIMNMNGAGRARARQFIEVMESSAPRSQPAAAAAAADADDGEGDESQASPPPSTALAVVESGSEIGAALDDQDFAALVAPGAMETEPDHRFAGLAVFAAGTAAAGGAAAVAGAGGAGGAAAAGAAVAAAAAVVGGSAVARRRSRRRSARTEPTIEAIATSTASGESAAALPDTEPDATTGEPDTTPDTTDTTDTEPDTTGATDTTGEPDTEPEGLLTDVSAWPAA